MGEPETAVTRRRSLRALGAGTLVAFAGCTATRDRIPFVGNEDEEGLHEHGYLFVKIDDQEIDFSESKYLVEESDEPTDEFHFHDYDEDARWHMHEIRLTLVQALDHLPDVESATEDGSHSLSVDGEIYRDGENASIEMTEREEGEIEPESHYLRDGDVIEIVVDSA